jgi:hypothetical protein
VVHARRSNRAALRRCAARARKISNRVPADPINRHAKAVNRRCAAINSARRINKALRWIARNPERPRAAPKGIPSRSPALPAAISTLEAIPLLHRRGRLRKIPHRKFRRRHRRSNLNPETKRRRNRDFDRAAENAMQKKA